MIPQTRESLKNNIDDLCGVGIAEKQCRPRVEQKCRTINIDPARELARTWTCVRVTVAFTGFLPSREVITKRSLMLCLYFYISSGESDGTFVSDVPVTQNARSTTRNTPHGCSVYNDETNIATATPVGVRDFLRYALTANAAMHPRGQSLILRCVSRVIHSYSDFWCTAQCSTGNVNIIRRSLTKCKSNGKQ